MSYDIEDANGCCGVAVAFCGANSLIDSKTVADTCRDAYNYGYGAINFFFVEWQDCEQAVKDNKLRRVNSFKGRDDGWDGGGRHEGPVIVQYTKILRRVGRPREKKKVFR